MPANWIFWLGFLLFVLAMLSLDLGVFNRKAHVVNFKEALIWTSVWIALAGVFAVLVFFFGHQMTGSGRPNHTLGMEFVTGYLIEEALSVDNLFVFLLIFRFFQVPSQFQHKVLFWGIIGALVMRMFFIFAGVALINRFHWIIYLFGVLLLYAAFKLLKGMEQAVDPSDNFLVKFSRRFLRITDDFHGGAFFIERHQRTWVTPLFLVLLVVETTDVAFAIDSIPAVLAITRDPFIVFTSNVFAILGLRSLYFALAGMMEIFHFLNYGLAIILAFIGVKMVASEWINIPIGVALGFVLGVLAISIAASLIFPKYDEPPTAA
jgi:tellurite resistance protein TerC